MPDPLVCTQCGTSLDSRATFCPTCGTAAPDPLLGADIRGRYIANRRIAIGGFGSIYRAREVATGHDVALKVMHRELANDPNLVARFRREGEVVRRLLDPHAVKTLEVGETATGLPFIAMELLDGDTLLAAFRASGPLPWPRAFAIGRDVCSALGEAHRLGIIHRDLKPANIFLTGQDHVKVLDFGIAKILATSEVSDPRELTLLGTAVGTVEYMAPEQLMGGRADVRSDIYALGVVLYEVICGQRPYRAAGLDLLTLQLAGPPPPPSTHVAVPAEVDAVLLRCLREDSDERFASADELARALEHTLAGVAREVSATPPAPPEVEHQTAARPPETLPAPRRVPALALIAAAALGAALAIWAIVSA